MSDILTQQNGHVFEITLNRPDKKNAFRIQMLQAMAAGVAHAERSEGVRVILLRGAEGNFCAGIDLMTMGGFPELMGDGWQQNLYEVTRLYQAAIHRLQQSTLPTIALLEGYCLGGGLEIALGCDLRLAAENTVISLEETRLGMIPDGGGTARLTHLIGSSRAKELIFTGRRIDAHTAERWGLVNQVVTQTDLLTAGQRVAEEIGRSAPLALAAAKRSINAIEGVEAGFHLEMVEQYPLFQSQDMQEGILAAVERRAARWQGR
jgi:enoyl-CoA hydratase/carnithine racemase